ncbi:MAG: hypothetical protein AB7P22_03240 [Vicinamibacterales bacterium]
MRFATALIRLPVLAALLLISAPPAFAQRRLVDAPPGPDILTHADFHLSAIVLGSDDDRFSWDTHWGGEVDLFDYVAGRVTFYGDYQAVLGNEFQPFDPNQGNYTLTLSSSLRLRESEVALVFNHVSRHLGDRPKTFGIAWNVLGARWLQAFERWGTSFELRADAGGVIQNAYVDYTWIAGADVRAMGRLNDRLNAYLRVSGELTGVDYSVAGRSTQNAGGVEGGIRFDARGGVLELFIGFARVIDADPIDRQPQRWGLGGFRLMNR